MNKTKAEMDLYNLEPGTLICTTKPNPEVDDWAEEALQKRKWGVWGIIITHHDSHGFCYDIKHEDGTVGSYDPSEIEVLDLKEQMDSLGLSTRDKKILLEKYSEKEVAVLLLFIKREQCTLKIAVRENFPEKH